MIFYLFIYVFALGGAIYKAEVETDEVYAQITLHPEEDVSCLYFLSFFALSLFI